MSQISGRLDKMERQRVGLLGIPIDYHCSYKRGPGLAPPIIRAFLRCEAVNVWTETGICLSGPDGMLDLGDLDLPEVEPAFDLIGNEIALILDKKLLPLSLGGDHAITYAILKAVRRRYPRLAVVQIDAHADTHHDFLGDKFSHASVFARAMEENLCDRLIQIGIRTLDDHQREQAKRFGIELIEMKDLGQKHVGPIDMPVYVTFDIDSLDPAFAPGVSHREPGGLSVREAIQLLHSLDSQIVGADLVEYNPECDLQNITAAVAAKLVKELAGTMLAARVKKENELYLYQT